MRPNSGEKILAGFVLALLLLLTTASLSTAQEEAQVSLEPLELTGQTLVIGVVAKNVTNLYGAEFKLRYDARVLAVTDADPDRDGTQVEPGDFLPATEGFVVVNQAEPEQGNVTYALTLLNPAPPVNGSGLLARVTFEVQQATPTLIEVEKAKLVSIDLQAIPNQMFGLSLDGSNTTPVEMKTAPDEVKVEPPVEGAPAAEVTGVGPGEAAAPAESVPPGSAAADPVAIEKDSVLAAPESAGEFPWWIVALGVMFLGFVGFGVLAVLGLNRTKPAPLPVASHDQTPGSPGNPTSESQPRQKHVPGTRPSAFK
jgi:hypothetical protein